MKYFEKEGVILPQDRIVIITKEYQIINPTEEQILADGWKEYIPEPVVIPPKLTPDESRKVQDFMAVYMPKAKAEVEAKTDQEALAVMTFCDTWAEHIGKQVKVGKRLYYDDKLYKVRQNHTVQENYPPSVDTAALYEEICKEHEGTLEDPIPYNNNMKLELNKYYVQYGVIYRCIRNSGNPIYQDLSELVDNYVKVVEDGLK